MSQTQDTELFQKLLVGFCQEEDPIKDMLQWMVNKLMEVEVTTLKTQVEKGTHSLERKTHRNGYRVRRWDTRLGTIYLTIPKVRTGGYQPFFLVNKQRSEAALMSVIQECWINGISTRKMMRVFKSFGIEDISAGQVSFVTKELDAEVKHFREAPLEESYPVIWIDALYEKIRDNNKVTSKAIMVALAINHEGQKEMVGKHLAHIFNQTHYSEAKQTAEEVISKFENVFPEAIEVLSDGIEDALQFFHFEALPFGRTSSTNHLERLNREIRRRSNGVGIFPSTDSYLRLIGSYLIEYQSDWTSGKSYINPDRLSLFWADFSNRKAA